DGRVLGFGSVSTNILAGLSNIVAIEADGGTATFLRPDGTIMRLSGTTLTVPPTGTNVVALEQWLNGYAALRADGTVALNGNRISGLSNGLGMGLIVLGCDNEVYLKR